MRRLMTYTCGAEAARRMRASEAARCCSVQASMRTIRTEDVHATSTPGLHWQVYTCLTILSDWIVSFSSLGMCLSC